MKAPEKIYRTTTYLDNDKGNTLWKAKPVAGAENVEYTSTDVFIEKACFYIKNMVLDITYSDVDGKDNYNIDEFIEDFKNYMKGE